MREENLRLLKKGVWLYFYLLLFEGALRKWVLPGLATPLLIIRDPLAIYLIFRYFIYEGIKPNFYISFVWMLSILSLALTLILGHGNISVALFGFRITVLHFPLIFIIGQVFNKKDVLKMGKILLWISIGMTILVAIQFFSPQSAWVNRGIGGDVEGSGFAGASGFYRVPGTFSFTNGLSLFYGLAGSFILYFWVAARRLKLNKALLVAATIALLVAIPLSLSRSVIFQVIISLLFLFTIVGRDHRTLGKISGTLILGLFLIVLLQNFTFMEAPTNALQERFIIANESEGGFVEGTLVDRFLGGTFGIFINPEISFWGAGLGMGTQVGSKLLVGERGIYLIAEGEWGRLVGEMGFLVGALVIIIRARLAGELLIKSWKAIGTANLLPWMLMSAGTLSILQGQWSQPTSLGFSILFGGLVISALKDPH